MLASREKLLALVGTISPYHACVRRKTPLGETGTGFVSGSDADIPLIGSLRGRGFRRPIAFSEGIPLVFSDTG